LDLGLNDRCLLDDGLSDLLNQRLLDVLDLRLLDILNLWGERLDQSLWDVAS
jgi:hypothetical protein